MQDPINFIDPKGLTQTLPYGSGHIAEPAFLLGGGGAAGVVGVGEGSVGRYAGTNFMGQSDSGYFGSQGVGLGVVVGVSAYLGYISDRNINTVNINLGIGNISGSIYLDPNNFNIIGGSLGPGAGIGGSITTTRSDFYCGGK